MQDPATPNSPAPPEVAHGDLDLVTLLFNYHDLGHIGVDRGRMDGAVFLALQPGGIDVIADHSGRPGTGGKTNFILRFVKS